MAVEGVAGVRSRATVRLSLTCNNHCVFCGQDGLVATGRSDLAADLARARDAGDEVTFVGGEPTLDAELAESIAQARALGFRRVGVQTNGGRMADVAYTTSLARAGLTDVHLSLHGADAAVHDYHTERPGSFGDLLAAIHAARVNELPVVVTTVLTRSNFRVLGAIPPLLATRGVAAWFVSVPVLAGRGAALRDRVVPRLGLALPFALHALAGAHALKLPSFLVGAPLCLVGPFSAHAIPGGSRAYAAVCASCPARSACPGVDASYLARFEGDELAPRDGDVGPAPSSALTAMFTGHGELALAPSASPVVTFRPRTSLPMLGKVKPAVAEASSGTERRTGEALKEIFPTLFEAAGDVTEAPASLSVSPETPAASLPASHRKAGET
jgi:hypothetical protein